MLLWLLSFRGHTNFLTCFIGHIFVLVEVFLVLIHLAFLFAFFSLLFTRARSLTQFCKVPVWPDSSCYRQFLNQEDTRGDKLPQHPPPPLVRGGKGYCTAHSRNKKEPVASPCTGTCQGVGSMTAQHMEHGAKPPVSLLSTTCFLPIKHLRLRPQDEGIPGAILLQ